MKEKEIINMLLSGSGDICLFRSVRGRQFFSVNLETDIRKPLSEEDSISLYRAHMKTGGIHLGEAEAFPGFQVEEA